MAVQRVALVVLDGFGERAEATNNAVRLARTPALAALVARAARGTLRAAGRAVGLPAGQMGNSEVGHLTLGAGRVVLQDLVRINDAVSDASFYENLTLLQAAGAALATGGRVHVLGLTSQGGVHSHTDHGLAVVRTMLRAGIPGASIFWHAFLDGRDTPPRSATKYLEELTSELAPSGVRIASAIGRMYAMDRDRRWARTELAYRALVEGRGSPAGDLRAAVEDSYLRGLSDEFIQPIVSVDAEGRALGAVRDGDIVVMFNFRSDRARQLTAALTQGKFDGFPRPAQPHLSGFVSMCEYDPRFGLPVVFPPIRPRPTLGEVVAASGLPQARIAETEKYAHVTYFFAGGVEAPLPREQRVLVPSQTSVITYDRAPEMSAAGVADAVVTAIQEGNLGPAFILANFANPDMVGHTGDLRAAIRAVEATDRALGRILEAARRHGVALLITADHGNCEQMWDEANDCPHTAHTSFPVPIWIHHSSVAPEVLPAGELSDVAPTILDLMGLPAPITWTGRSLLPRNLRVEAPIPGS